MLKFVTIRNYKSILDVFVNLAFSEGKAPNGWKDYEMMPFLDDGVRADNRRVPVQSIYGANASGKTNILNAIGCFKNVIRHGIEERFCPNRINPKYTTTTFILGVGYKDGDLEYGVEYNRFGIVHEWLFEKIREERRLVFEIKECVVDASGIVSDTYPSVKLEQVFQVECSDGHGQQRKTFLNCLVQGYAGLSSRVMAVHSDFIGKTAVYSHNRQSLSYALKKLTDVSASIGVNDAFDKIIQVLSKFDFSLRRMTLERQEIAETDVPNILIARNQRILRDEKGRLVADQITAFHTKVDGTLEPFNFMTEESEGTRVAAAMIGICLWALETGSVVFFDELDRSLHPIILVELVHLFKRKTMNRHNGQLVFTLHDTTLLEDPMMRVSEVAVVNNNPHTGTTLTRLSELDRGDDNPVRNIHNFRKQYMEGILTGVPHPVI